MDAIANTLSNNSVWAYFLSIVIFAAGVLVVRAIKFTFDRKVKTYLESADFKLRGFIIGVIEKNALPFLYFVSFYIAAGSLYIHPKIERLINAAGLFILCFFAARIITTLIDELLTRAGTQEGEAPPVPRGVLTLLKIIVWSLVAIFLLDNLGFDITTLIAGVGIGGVALALATQAILGDLFNYFVILFDKPFQKGDFIIVADKLGVVEHIGLKTTRIRSLSGEELVFSNTDLTNSRVHNYKKMERRRVVFKVGVTYQTTTGQMRQALDIIKETINGIDDATLDRCHFSSYGDFALIIETVFYITGADYNKYMDIQQRINFALKDEFERIGVEFAYPTQTLYMVKQPE